MIRWGILGASGFALRTMAPAIHRARNAQLAALATRDAGKAAPFAALAPGVRVLDGYAALLADPGIDAVYIPLPNSLHVPWVLRAITAGKPVLCEKPLALRAEDVAQVIAARDHHRVLAAEALMIAHHPQWSAVRDLLDSGAIGTLRHVQGVFTYFNDDPANIRNQRDLGGGALPDIGLYPVGALRLATGYAPIRLSHADLRFDNGVDTDAHFGGQVADATFSVHVSMRAARHQAMCFHGTRGLIHLPAPFNPGGFAESRIDLIRGTHRESWRFPTADQYVAQVEAFGTALTTGDFALPLEVSLGTQQIIDNIYGFSRKDRPQ